MRTIFLSVIILFLLTACGVAAPASTPAPTATATILPTITLTTSPTFTSTTAPISTPTVTFTPTPVVELPEKVVKSVESSLTGYKVCNGDQLCDSNGNVLPKYRVVPIKSDTSWALAGERTFILEGQTYTYTNILTPRDVAVKDGILDMQAERFENGVLSNQNRLDADGNPIEGKYLYAYNDVIAALEDAVAKEGLREGEETVAVARELLGFPDQNTPTLSYEGEDLVVQSYWTGSDDLTIVGEDGNTIEHVRTTMYAFVHTLENNTIVAFRRDGKIVKMMVEGPVKLKAEMKKVVLNSR